MATASVTNTLVNGSTPLAAIWNTNYQDLVDFLNNSVVHRDGSKAMTNSLDMGGHDLTNLGALNGAIRTSGMVASDTLAAGAGSYETVATIADLHSDAVASYLLIGSFFINASIGADVKWTARFNPEVDSAPVATAEERWDYDTMGGTVRTQVTFIGHLTTATGSQELYLQVTRDSTSGTQVLEDIQLTAIRYA